MTTEQPKTATNSAAAPEPASAPAPIQLPPFNGSFPPLPPGYPPFFAFPPPATDGQQGEGSAPTPLPYPILYPPPGMVYAFPPPQPAPAVVPPTPASSKPKRRQVKMACTNCAAACKRCDETRPCERCKKYGMADSCADGQRKERKKGIKRGPYKRKNKSQDDNFDYNSSQSTSEGGEWPQSSPPPPPNAATTSAAVPTVPQFAPPEGFYPIYIPPGYPLPEPQANADGSAPSGTPTLMPFYIGGFAPYPGYPAGAAIFQLPPLGTHPLPPPALQPQAAEAGTVSAIDKSSEEVAGTTIQNDSRAGTPSAIPQDASKDDNAGETDAEAASTDSAAIKEHDRSPAMND